MTKYIITNESDGFKLKRIDEQGELSVKYSKNSTLSELVYRFACILDEMKDGQSRCITIES